MLYGIVIGVGDFDSANHITHLPWGVIIIQYETQKQFISTETEIYYGPKAVKDSAFSDL